MLWKLKIFMNRLYRKDIVQGAHRVMGVPDSFLDPISKFIDSQSSGFAYTNDKEVEAIVQPLVHTMGLSIVESDISDSLAADKDYFFYKWHNDNESGRKGDCQLILYFTDIVNSYWTGDRLFMSDPGREVISRCNINNKDIFVQSMDGYHKREKSNSGLIKKRAVVSLSCLGYNTFLSVIESSKS